MKTKPFLLVMLAMLFAFVSLPLIVLAGDTAAAAASSTTPWWQSTGFIAAAVAFIPSVIAIWQNKSKKTAQKLNETLVEGIELAATIPEVVAAEKKIKDQIKATAEKYGVEPLLHRLVKDLT
jgi:membrane protein implicated in regulation of membrane protease activity